MSIKLDPASLGPLAMLRALVNTGFTLAAAGVALTFESDFGSVVTWVGLGLMALLAHGLAELISAGWYKEQVLKIARDRGGAAGARDAASAKLAAANIKLNEARETVAEARTRLQENKPLHRAKYRASWLQRRYAVAVRTLGAQGKYILNENGHLYLRDLPSHLRVEDIATDPPEIEYPLELRE